MRNIFTFCLSVLISVSGFAQNFNWGYPFGGDSEDGYDVQHAVDGDVYRIKSIYDTDLFNYRITADRFSGEDLEKAGSVYVGIPAPMMGRSDETHHSMYPENGTEYIFFSRKPNRETAVNEFYWQRGDIKTGEKSDYKLLSTIEGKSNMNNGYFHTAQSANGQFYAVLKDPAFFKKTLQIVEIELYDKDFKKIDQIKYEFEWPAERAPKNELHVGDNGDVYFIKTVNLKKMKPYDLVYYWDRGAKTLKEISLQQPDDFQIVQNYTYFIDNHFYIASLLTGDGSTTFGMKIDMDGRHSGAYVNALLAIKLESGNVMYHVRNNFENPVSNLSIKSILPNGENQYVVMEKAYVNKKSNSTDPMASNITYTYTYLNNGFFISLIDSKTGDVKWNYNINTSEPDTQNDNGAYLSVLPLINNGNLVLLYNETRDIRTGKIHNPLLKRFPIMETINPGGETISRMVLTSAGVGIEEEQMFDLDTGVIVPISDGKYLIRARSRAEYKYGYLQL